MKRANLHLDPADEDIHMAIEKELISVSVKQAENFIPARSRNDQIVLDVRLFLRTEIDKLSLLLIVLCR